MPCDVSRPLQRCRRRSCRGSRRASASAHGRADCDGSGPCSAGRPGPRPERDKCGIKTMGAVDDDELWPLQPARTEVGEVTVDRGLAVKPRLDDGAVRTETDDIFVGEPSTGRFPDPPHSSSAGDNAAAPWSAIQ